MLGKAERDHGAEGRAWPDLAGHMASTLTAQPQGSVRKSVEYDWRNRDRIRWLGHRWAPAPADYKYSPLAGERDIYSNCVLVPIPDSALAPPATPTVMLAICALAFLSSLVLLCAWKLVAGLKVGFLSLCDHLEAHNSPSCRPSIMYLAFDARSRLAPFLASCYQPGSVPCGVTQALTFCGN